jgi:hypothetical protein
MSTSASANGSTERVPFKQENSFGTVYPPVTKILKVKVLNGWSKGSYVGCLRIPEKRVRLAAKIRSAHPDRVPVIVEKHARSKLIADISKRKYERLFRLLSTGFFLMMLVTNALIS